MRDYRDDLIADLVDQVVALEAALEGSHLVACSLARHSRDLMLERDDMAFRYHQALEHGRQLRASLFEARASSSEAA